MADGNRPFADALARFQSQDGRIEDLEDFVHGTDRVDGGVGHAKFLAAPGSGSSIGNAGPPLWRSLIAQDLPLFVNGDRKRTIGATWDDYGRSLFWHRSTARPADGVVALNNALDYDQGNGDGHRHVVWGGWNWQFDATPPSAQFSNSIIGFPNGIAPGAPAQIIGTSNTGPVWRLQNVKSFRMSETLHMAYRAVPLLTSFGMFQIDGGSSDIYIDTLILTDANVALYLDNCSRVRIRRLIAIGAMTAIVATATAQDVVIGEVIGGGAPNLAVGHGVTILSGNGATPKPVAEGGTGAATAAAARTNLGAQAQSAMLDKLAVPTPVASKLVILNASNNAQLIDALVGQSGTPVFSAVTPGDLSVAYNAGNAISWDRIGAMLMFQATWSFTPTFTTATGDALLGGLPFNVSPASAVQLCAIFSFPAAIAWPNTASDLALGFTVSSSAGKILGFKSGASPTALAVTAFTSGTAYTIRASGSIRVA